MSSSMFSSFFSRPAIPATLLLIAGILSGAVVPGFNGIAGCLAGAAMMVAAYGFYRARAAGLTAFVALAATGYLSISPWLPQDHGPGHITHYLDSGHWWINGTVTAVEPDLMPDRSRIRMAVETLSRQDVAHRVRGQIRISITGRPLLSPGNRIRLFSQIRSFQNFNNPGAFDYRRHMAFQGVYGSAWTSSERIQIRDADALSRMQWIQNARTHLGQLMDQAGKSGNPDAVAVLKALVYGDQSGIHAELRDRFNRSGVGHLLSISGLHVAIVATVTFFGFRWLLAGVPFLLWRGWARSWAAVATLFPVAAYGVLAGMAPATQRAVIMVGLFLLSLLVGRRHDTLNTLFVAALIMLTIFPPALFSVSFQLSFSAVLAIVYGMRKIRPADADTSEQKKPFSQKIVAWVKNTVLCSLLAIAGVMPVTLMYFNEMSLVGVMANIVLVPLAGSVAVPLGLMASLAGCVSDAAAIWGFRLTLAVLELALMGVDAFAHLPFASVKTITPSVPEAILYTLAFWATLNFRRQRGAAWVLVAVLVLAVLDGGYWIWNRFFHPDIRVTAIDVGQASATLVELPGGPVMMVDGGGFPDNVRFDVGKQVIAPLLWRKKIATVDILVLSHPDSDHLNGLVYLARHFHVRELWTTLDAATTSGYQALMAACTEKNIWIRRMAADAEKTEINGVVFQIFNPTRNFFDAPEKNRANHRNNGSLVLKGTFGQVSFLFTGDILASAERAMIRRIGPADLSSTVLFVPHHGSRTSSSTELVTAVSPDLAVICAGKNNPFGFPHPDVTARYHQAGSRVVCTCTHGAITVKTDGKRLVLETIMGSTVSP